MAPLTTTLGTQPRAQRLGGFRLRAPWRRLRIPEFSLNPRATDHDRAERARLTGTYRDACADPSESMSDICRIARYSR